MAISFPWHLALKSDEWEIQKPYLKITKLKVDFTNGLIPEHIFISIIVFMIK